METASLPVSGPPVGASGGLGGAGMGQLGLNGVTIPLLNQLIGNVNQMTQLNHAQQVNLQALQSRALSTATP